ncbi:PQ loop repeat-domain-containing protein [Astrocystis sublimbata]|nr:PQ loop repeat-domain-containing protein [Astrocystis sublimbata]
MYFLGIVSSALGWIYTICWSASFYPQAILNYRRKTTGGTTVDFPFLNVLGFACYLIYTSAFYWSPVIRYQYALRNRGHTPTVAFNDVAFAFHAFILTLVLNTQYFLPSLWNFELNPRQKPTRFIAGVFAGCIGAVLTIIYVVAAQSPDADARTSWAWLDVIYITSYVKVLITAVKYAPQLLLNHRARSTQGWDISQILLDFTGGLLSLAQLGIDSYLQHDWSGVTGNLAKVILGNVSVFYDLLFMGQHFWLYRDARSNRDTPLLTSGDSVRDPDSMPRRSNRDSERGSLLERGEDDRRLD